MENIIIYKIQIISIIISLSFLVFICNLIIRGKLREEYSIVWILCTFLLIIFSFWRKGIDIVSGYVGVYYSPALFLMGGFLAIVVFLIHLSIVNSKQQEQIKKLAHEIAFLKFQLEKIK